MNNEVHKLGNNKSHCYITTFVRAWNSHTLPGRNGGIPYELAAHTRQTRMFLLQLVPSAARAVTLH